MKGSRGDSANNMKISSVAISLLRTNCYLLLDEKSGEAAVVDPGKYNDAVREMLVNNGVKRLKYILLTHGHYDHLFGVAELKRDFGGEVAIHELDSCCLEEPEKALAKSSIARNFLTTKADITLKEGSRLSLGDTVISVLHTPGHTDGSICYVFDDVMLSGDTLFCGTVGRTDLPGGDPITMTKTIGRLSRIKEDYRVYPGHEQSTTLSIEQRTNPFFNMNLE